MAIARCLEAVVMDVVRDPPSSDVGTSTSVDPAEAVVVGVAIHAAQCFLRTGCLKVCFENFEKFYFLIFVVIFIYN